MSGKDKKKYCILLLTSINLYIVLLYSTCLGFLYFWIVFIFKDLILSCRDTFSSIKPFNNLVQVTRDTICQFMCQPHNYYICRLISCIYTLHIRIYECGLKLYRLKLYNGILECDVIKS